MNKHMSRGLALVAITGGFVFLGTTAANAVTVDDDPGLLGNGGLLGTGISLGNGSDGDLLGNLHVPVDANAPATVNGLDVSILDNGLGSGSGSLLGTGSLLGADSLLGDGILVNTGESVADIFANPATDGLGDGVFGSTLSTALDVPVDASNTWISVLGNPANGPTGVVVVPNVATEPLAVISNGEDGILDGFVDAPVDVSCTSITVLSNYQGACPTEGDNGGTGDNGSAGDTDGGILDGILGGDIVGDGVLVDLGDTVADVTAGTDGTGDVAGQSADVDVPVDLSDAWVSILGDDGGIVIVPDLGIDTSAVSGGLIDSDVTAPISLQCTSITVLSDFTRDCDGSTTPEEPTTPVLPTLPLPVDGDGTPTVPGDGTGNGGGNTDVNPCLTTDTAGLTSAVTPTNAGFDFATIGVAGLVGGLIAAGTLLLGRKFSKLN